MKKGTLATALIGFGISQIILGVVTSKKREKEFKRSMDEAAQNATDYLKRQMQRNDPYVNAGAFGVSAAMKKMEEIKKNDEEIKALLGEMRDLKELKDEFGYDFNEETSE